MKTKNIKLNAGLFIATVIMLMASMTSAVDLDSITRVQIGSELSETCVRVPSQHSGYTYDYDIDWSQTWTDGNYLDTTGGKLALDTQNNVITYVSSAATSSYKLIKYNTNGVLQWEITIDYEGTVQVEDVEHEGQVAPLGGGFDDFAISILNRINSEYWVQDILTDAQNNIYVVGERCIGMSEPPDKEYVYIFKYDSDGNEIWKKGYTDLSEYMLPGIDSDIDSTGNIYVPCMTFYGAYLLKVDSDGDFQWIKRAKTLPVYYPLSVAVNTYNDYPTLSLVDCAYSDGENMKIGFTVFHPDTGLQIVSTLVTLPMSFTMLHDAALTIDVGSRAYFGLGNKIVRLESDLETITWIHDFPAFVNDIEFRGDKLFVSGGWCELSSATHYYAAMYYKNTGELLLQMALGELIYCEDPFFQGYFNQLQSVAIDWDYNMYFSGGEGGLYLVKAELISIPEFGPGIEIMQAIDRAVSHESVELQ